MIKSPQPKPAQISTQHSQTAHPVSFQPLPQIPDPKKTPKQDPPQQTITQSNSWLAINESSMGEKH